MESTRSNPTPPVRASRPAALRSPCPRAPGSPRLSEPRPADTPFRTCLPIVPRSRCYHPPGDSRLHTYTAYGSFLASPVPFPELRSCRGPAEWVLALARRAPEPRDGGWARTWRTSGRAWLSTKTIQGGWRMRFHGTADFDVLPSRRAIAVRPSTAAGPALVRHLLLDQVLPRALHRPDAPVLHASAVLVHGGVAAFAGASGRGKSTLAAAFAQSGRPLFADDALRLLPRGGGFVALPGYPGLRLGGDSLGLLGRPGPRVAEGHWKRRVVPRWAERPARLRAIYLVKGGRRVAIEQVPGPRRVAEILAAGMRPGHGQDDAAAELEGAVALADAVPVRVLRVPRRLEALPAVVAAVLGDRPA